MQQRFVKRSQMLFLGSFAFAIVIGTLALKLPGTHPERPLSWTDSLFTATSSVCVTGLTVVGVEEFNWLGQLVLLILIQIGGIGIMTLSASILLLLGRGLSFSDSLLVSNLNDKFALRGTESLTRTVITYSFVSEAVGFLVILPGCFLAGDYPWWRCLWNALFLAVSSFCNAGLAPFADSLISQHWLTRLGCGGMIVLGGLGVYVIYDLLQVAKKRQRSLRVHSKLVLVTTAVLLVGGMVLLKLFSILSSTPLGWGEALFMSATCRTAGFACVEIASLPSVSLALCVVLMMIGGSPGSTAGGIKTSTVAVAVAAIHNTLKGNQETLLFHRRIPGVIVLRAFTIIVLFSLLGGAGVLLLQLVSPTPGITGNAFETVSALCTVGLSIGDTTVRQSNAGRLLLTVFMFIGRIGPFTFLLFLLDREGPGQLKYPEERVIIG